MILSFFFWGDFALKIKEKFKNKQDEREKK